MKVNMMIKVAKGAEIGDEIKNKIDCYFLKIVLKIKN